MLNVSLDGELRVSKFVARDCYNNSVLVDNDIFQLSLLTFSISYTKNKFTAVGCDTFMIFNGLYHGDKTIPLDAYHFVTTSTVLVWLMGLALQLVVIRLLSQKE